MRRTGRTRPQMPARRPSTKELIHEEFGDGIMSAIDFTLDMEKVTGSQGEARCKITLNGKWLEYKTF